MSEKFKCKRCSKDFDKYESLRRHVSKIHKIHAQDFYSEFYLNGVYPVCKCGCGERTKWVGHGFQEWKRGHISRIHNNWGHNQKAIDHSAETRRQQYVNGERQSWCKGLTVETDERVRKLSEKTKKSINSNPDELKRRAESMSKNRRNGTIPTLYREKSSQWKGGVSSIQQVARGDNRFYDQWKYPILKEVGFKCQECQSIKDLHIHHDKETFSDIIKKVMTIEDYEHIDEFERKKQIVNKILEYHVKNKVSGKVLCKECHGHIHPSLNF